MKESTVITAGKVDFFLPFLSHVQRRLEKTCFRDPETALSGNFCQPWHTIANVVEHLKLELGDDFLEAYTEGTFGSNSCCIDYNAPVGWSGTDDIHLYTKRQLRKFNPSVRSTGLAVTDHAKKLAPVTHLVTVVYELRKKPKGAEVIVHSMYPGNDIGELEGDISKSEKIVFFDWNRRGAPLPN